MALSGTYKKSVELFIGEVERENSYITIKRQVITKTAVAHIDVLSERGGFLVDSIEIRDIPLDLEGGNYHTQIYNHLKTLPQFAGCVDVME